jgi:predicted nucleic acid-binding protein
MCIVVDTNTLSNVFKREDKKHTNFKPVLDWILEGNGKLIVGGSKFNDELFKEIAWFRKLFLQLVDLNKVVRIDNKKVDIRQAALEQLLKHRDFDDPHLLALIAESKCRVLCTGDKRAFPFIQDRNLYPKRVTPPAIYSARNNADLLCNKNLADCCLPKVKLKKRDTAKILA